MSFRSRRPSPGCENELLEIQRGVVLIRRYSILLFLFLFLAAGYTTAQTSGSPHQSPPSKPAPTTPGSKGEKSKTQLYSLGDQMFVVNLGLLAPLFLQDPKTGAILDPQLSAGGVGSLEVDVYLNNNLAAGVEFGGAFTFGLNNQDLFLVPITAKISWIFHLYPFDFPIFFGAGVNFLRLNTQLFVGPILKPGAAAYWNITSKWSVGMRLEYWWVPEIYFGPSPQSSRSRFGNFLTVSLSGLYHF